MYPQLSDQPDARTRVVTITGAAAADPVKVQGAGVAVTRVSAGLYQYAWARSPGLTYVGATPSLRATTPSSLAGYTVVVGDYVLATRSVQVLVLNASNAATDLTAAQGLHVVFDFRDGSLVR